MKASIFLFLITLSTVAFSQKLEKKLIGRWEMTEVIQDGKDVSDEHNPKKNRYFIFKDDGTFESGGDPYGENTGRYFVNGLSMSLYLDSSQGPDDDSMWYPTFNGDKLSWQGFGTDWADRFIVKFKRSSN